MLSGTTPFAAFFTSGSDAKTNLEDDVGLDSMVNIEDNVGSFLFLFRDRGSQGFLDALFLFRDRESRGFFDADGFATSLAISLAVDYFSQDESSQLHMCRYTGIR